MLEKAAGGVAEGAAEGAMSVEEAAGGAMAVEEASEGGGDKTEMTRAIFNTQALSFARCRSVYRFGSGFALLATTSPLQLNNEVLSDVSEDASAFSDVLHSIESARKLRQVLGSHDLFVSVLHIGLQHRWSLDSLHTFSLGVAHASEDIGAGDVIVSFTLESTSATEVLETDDLANMLEVELSVFLATDVEVVTIVPGCKVVTAIFKENVSTQSASGASSAAPSTTAAEKVEKLQQAIGARSLVSPPLRSRGLPLRPALSHGFAPCPLHPPPLGVCLCAPR
eukprot:1091998-Prymnesium_polylepis.1